MSFTDLSFGFSWVFVNNFLSFFYSGTSPTSPTGTTTMVTIDTGNYYEGNAGRNSNLITITLINCNYAALVMQYDPAYDAQEMGSESNHPNEFMITVPPTSHYTNAITFSTSQYYVALSNATQEFVDTIIIIANLAAITANSIQLDGVSINGQGSIYFLKVIQVIIAKSSLE